MSIRNHWLSTTRGRRTQSNASARLEFVDGVLHLHSSYSPALVAALKASIPMSDRRWNPDLKLWEVAPEHAEILASLCGQHLGVFPELPDVPDAHSKPQTTILDLRYLGRVKKRTDGTETASGWVDGGWNAIFPGHVLKQWFGADDRPSSHSTLYAVLGVKRTADASEIKKAYRRAARTWHPDVSNEPDTEAMFVRIQQAYEVLSNDNLRDRYNAGLTLEASLSTGEQDSNYIEYAAPLRCGYVMISGVHKLGRWAVDKIEAWEDIRDNQGRVLVSSWPANADHFVEKWT